MAGGGCQAANALHWDHHARAELHLDVSTRERLGGGGKRLYIPAEMGECPGGGGSGAHTVFPPPPPVAHFCCSLFFSSASYDWVTSYKIQFSNDTHTWQPCKNGSEEVVSVCAWGRGG